MATEQPEQPEKTGARARVSLIMDAKEMFLHQFNGAVMVKEIAFGSPAIQGMFRRTYDITARNIHFIKAIGPIIAAKGNISREVVDGPIQHITSAFDNAIKEFKKQIAVCEVVLNDAKIGAEDYLSYNAPRIAHVKLIDRDLSKRHLEMLLTADRLLLLLNTMSWHCEIDDKEYAKRQVDVKRKLRAVSYATRNMYISLRKRFDKVAGGASVETASAAPDAPDAANDDADNIAEGNDAVEDTQASSNTADTGTESNDVTATPKATTRKRATKKAPDPVSVNDEELVAA